MGSLLLSPGSWCTPGSVCALQESVSPVLCKFWWLYGRVNGNLLQEGLCHIQLCCTQSPCPLRQATAHLYLCRRHSNTVLAQSLWGLWDLVHIGFFEPSEHLWPVRGLILNVISPFLPSYWCCSFALGRGVSFFGGIQHSPVDSCSAASCSFGVLGGESTPFYSAILCCQVFLYHSLRNIPHGFSVTLLRKIFPSPIRG